MVLVVTDGTYVLLEEKTAGVLEPIARIDKFNKYGRRDIERCTGVPKKKVSLTLDLNIRPDQIGPFINAYDTNAYPGTSPRRIFLELLRKNGVAPWRLVAAARINFKKCSHCKRDMRYIRAADCTGPGQGFWRRISQKSMLIQRVWAVKLPKHLFNKLHQIQNKKIRLVTKEEVVAGSTIDGVRIHQSCKKLLPWAEC